MAASQYRTARSYVYTYNSFYTLIQVADSISRAIRNSQESPLLKLPAEIRNQIWTYALGGKVIDVADTPKSMSRRLSYAHNLCNGDSLCTITRFFADVSAQRRVRASSGNGIGCALQGKKGRLRFSLFFVCRQVYGEVKLLPYAENVFFFWNVEGMERFVREVRTRDQAAAMVSQLFCACLLEAFADKTVLQKEIAVVLELGTMMLPNLPHHARFFGNSLIYNCPHYWDTGKIERIVKMLTGLRCINLLIKIPVHGIIGFIDYQNGDWKNHRWLEGVLRFKEAGLKEAHVVGHLDRGLITSMASSAGRTEQDLMRQWQLTDKDIAEYTDGIEKALLDRSLF